MKDENYGYENLKNFKYIDMLQKEVTRFHGPGTYLFSRMANTDNYLNGIQVRKGTVVNLATITNHHS
jgi:cytochrome P450